MQITQKYNYADLKRQDGDTRLYLTPDGEALPSVTTILGRTKDKTFLKKWRQKVGEKKAEQIIKDSAQIGTALHLYIERFVNGDKYKDLTEIGIQAEKMAQKIKVTQIRSKIGSQKNQIASLRGLGLRKINSNSVLENTPEIRGMIRKINHLVRIESVD